MTSETYRKTDMIFVIIAIYIYIYIHHLFVLTPELNIWKMIFELTS